MFKKASDDPAKERTLRKKMLQKKLSFGVDFLDDALRGILQDDLILLGAPSGLGKTQLCCNIALSNLKEGKRVHYVALEAAEHEIERRMKYPLVYGYYNSSPNKKKLVTKLNYADWYMGVYGDELEEYEKLADQEFSGYSNLNLHYKADKFDVSDLIEAVLVCSDKTDLIIIDHVHYFDFDDDNENRAIREIAKTVRTLALDEQKPIVLVAHLRKRDRHSRELVAGLEEFHGSSDLYKIATKVITMAPGKPIGDGTYETFFRIPKNRIDGGVCRYFAREIYDPAIGGYRSGEYELATLDKNFPDCFEMLDLSLWPSWAQRSRSHALSTACSNSFKSATIKSTYA